MSVSLPIRLAVTPVSSWTSRREAASGFSPGSTKPLGRARIVLRGSRLRPVDEALVEGSESSFSGSMAAIHQLPERRRMTTPPAENSRTIAHKLTGIKQFVTMASGGERRLSPHADRAGTPALHPARSPPDSGGNV